MYWMTSAQRPPMKPSDEATEAQLDLAREQGDALGHALEGMGKIDEEATRRAGDYLISYAIEEAEGMYHPKAGRLVWQEPKDENLHVEVVVRDGADGRFIPGLSVFATLIDSKGKEIGTHEQPFLWHPWLYHYGRNWQVPGDGTYTLQVRIEAPSFPRHDKENGQRYVEPVDVEFKNVKVKTGQKI